MIARSARRLDQRVLVEGDDQKAPVIQLHPVWHSGTVFPPSLTPPDTAHSAAEPFLGGSAPHPHADSKTQPPISPLVPDNVKGPSRIPDLTVTAASELNQHRIVPNVCLDDVGFPSEVATSDSTPLEAATTVRVRTMAGRNFVKPLLYQPQIRQHSNAVKEPHPPSSEKTPLTKDSPPLASQWRWRQTRPVVFDEASPRQQHCSDPFQVGQLLCLWQLR